MSAARIAIASFAVLASACAATGGGPAGSAPAQRLAGTKWIAVTGPDAERRTVPRLEFTRDGRLTGYTGCNLLSATFTFEADRIVLGPVATTKRACPGPEGDREKLLLEVLSADPRVVPGPRGLVLEAGNGRRFEFVEAPPAY